MTPRFYHERGGARPRMSPFGGRLMRSGADSLGPRCAVASHPCRCHRRRRRHCHRHQSTARVVVDVVVVIVVVVVGVVVVVVVLVIVVCVVVVVVIVIVAVFALIFSVVVPFALPCSSREPRPTTPDNQCTSQSWLFWEA